MDLRQPLAKSFASPCGNLSNTPASPPWLQRATISSHAIVLTNSLWLYLYRSPARDRSWALTRLAHSQEKSTTTLCILWLWANPPPSHSTLLCWPRLVPHLVYNSPNSATWNCPWLFLAAGNASSFFHRCFPGLRRRPGCPTSSGPITAAEA
ncbi:hypothetical protein LZ31DRAFT_51885 [Colletotrichum somersetense]|nr:hypothetical protein LZ31DRAFT_51885 [Colletotrichum somersetense]